MCEGPSSLSSPCAKYVDISTALLRPEAGRAMLHDMFQQVQYIAQRPQAPDNIAPRPHHACNPSARLPLASRTSMSGSHSSKLKLHQASLALTVSPGGKVRSLLASGMASNPYPCRLVKSQFCRSLKRGCLGAIPCSGRRLPSGDVWKSALRLSVSAGTGGVGRR